MCNVHIFTQSRLTYIRKELEKCKLSKFLRSNSKKRKRQYKTEYHCSDRKYKFCKTFGKTCTVHSTILKVN